ncbi:MG2 domain-containing protein [Paraflavisolibacter sp. H34]|uniref:alpha-2-macroglobulin family protein n=1 Tax=Huijunlia imazamoxiresistens TaxID=3127457 RepID=UPI003019393A
MRNQVLFAAFVAAALFLCACNRKSVSLSYTNARNEVPQLGNLVFRFSKPLAPDSLLNAWDSSGYIAFEPAIRGRFRWQSPDELVFSPSQPLLPATTYKARIQNEVLRYSTYDKVQKEKDISFYTPALQLEDAQSTWVLEEGSRTAVPQISLKFNYPVQPEDVKEKLDLQIDGVPREYSLLTVSPDHQVTLRLGGFSAQDKAYEARLVVAKGLQPLKGRNRTEEALNATLSIPSPYVLNVNSIESEHDGTEGRVTIRTSQQLNAANSNSFVRFEPAVPFTVEYTDFGVVLRSPKFDAEESYTVHLLTGLRGSIGGTLREDYTGSVAFGKIAADIAFTDRKAVYLSKKGNGNIEVRITSTPKVKLIISKIYENNILMAERNGYYPADRNERDEEEAEYASYQSEYIEPSAGDVVYTKEIDTRSLPRSGNARILNIAQFEDRLPDAKGIYHVKLRSTENYWVSDSRFLSLSDIGLIAKQGRGKMLVFANSLRSATAQEGVTINVYGSNNQLLGTGATNKEGVAEVPLAARDFAGYRPAMVIAKTADDFNYLPFSNTRVNTSRFDVGGKQPNAAGLDAFVYAERDIYRPGERVNFSVVLRDRQWKSPGALPVKLKFLLPNGKELKTFRKSLNEQGSAEASVDISPAALTGSYLLEVYTANEVLLASKNFMIEEFVPDRIKVTARLDKPFLRPSDQTNLVLSAVNFFGPPAANRSYEAEIQVKQKQFSPKSFPGYDFSLENQRSFFDKEVKEGKTDAQGAAVEPYTVPSLYQNIGLLQATFYTTVFDETGRPVSRSVKADIFTQDVFHGVKDDGFHYYALNQPVKFLLASVGRDGQAVTATAHVQVIKHEYKTVLARSGSYFRYESQQQDKQVADGQLTVGPSTLYTFVPRSPGDYELRVYRPGANAYVSKRFYSYGAWGSDNSSFEVNTEGEIDISLDKDAYEGGSSARVLFKTPFSGRMLVTLESDQVLWYRYVDVGGRSASLDLDLGGQHVPNVYVTATLFKPHGVSDIPLTVAHGFHSIAVEEKSRRMPVAISAPKSVRSRTRQKVRVKAEPGSFVTLAAVDNGVLQVTDFKTPDPYGYYYQKQALGVAAFDLYPLLFPERRLSSTGGDGGLSMDRRVNPMPAKRFKILSYWSGIRQANGSGVADFEFDVPQFNGQVRYMAVAYKNDHFGSAEGATTVADPLVVSSALPRFLSPGDTVTLPVTINNTTGKAAAGQATVTTSGPVTVIGGSTQTLSLAPGSEGRLLFRVAAFSKIETAKILVSVQALGERFSEETDISVRPPSTLQFRTGSGSITGGGTQKIPLPAADFLPGSARYELVVSRSPAAEIAGQLQYLVTYPYGCTEQTVSAAFPQLYYADLADVLRGSKNGRGNANANVLEAIRKIKMRQLYNGAVTLWDGEGTEDWWTTVYAAHFLLEARKAGFDVDNSLVETMLGYLGERLKSRQTINYYYNRDQQRKIAPKEVPYSLYVLALAGRTQVPAMNYYKANQQYLALDGRYLLSAAYAVSGDKRSFAALLPQSFSGEESVQQTGGSFYSATRDEALALNALMDVDPGNAQVPQMARHLAGRLKTERYLNTQERSFSFLALGKIARLAARSNVTADIRSGGKTVARVAGADWKGGSNLLQGGEVEIATRGSGRLYYYWQAEGISTGGYTEEDNFLKVRRTFYDRNGRELTGNSFVQNDLVIVGITLEKAYSNLVENVVVTDLLPAGFEIENPRTKELPGMDWIKNAAEPVALDVRDDRIHFFVDARAPKQTYYYAVRAVSPGIFRQGPVSADALYNGEMHSYHGAQTIKVVER